MADRTGIEWTDATWNPVTGCSVVSAGCTNCYAMQLAGTRLRNHPSRAGLTSRSKAGPVWNGKVRFNEDWLDQPLRWRRPRLIFVCAHGDLFHPNVPDAWIDRVFAVMALAPQHRFQVLTKRSARMLSYVRQLAAEKLRRVDMGDGTFVLLPYEGGVPRNIWLGVSVEDQRAAEERVPDLLETPAAVRFTSLEPLLGPVDLSCIRLSGGGTLDALAGRRLDVDGHSEAGPALGWGIVGGESGRGDRPMQPDWARSLRDQHADAGVPFFFKQWGDWAFHLAYADGGDGRLELGAEPIRLRYLDGVEHSGMPAW